MKLAINGGQKVRKKPFPAYNTMGSAEEKAVLRVLKSGKLSTFLGTWHDDFYGGEEVQKLEKNWAKFFKVKHAISLNSATSALYAAVGAIGIKPGDEVIVSPYTMSATASAILLYGGIPVFADVESEYFCIDANSVKSLITPKTKAIIAVDILGQPYDKNAINSIAKEHNLKLIEDTAQAPYATFNGEFAGTLGDIGVFSLNYHKHIHTGEGGIAVTNDDELAFRIKLIRNHAEAVLGTKGYAKKEELHNMLGFNFRLGEIEAAIASEQLKKLKKLVEKRVENVHYLANELENIAFLSPAKTRENATHSYYVHALKFDSKIAKIKREVFVNALKAELPRTIMRDDSDVLISQGYAKPLYLLPLYQERVCFGEYPFNLSKRVYKKGDCPVCEELHFNSLITHELMRAGMKKQDLDDVLEAFFKVASNLDELR